MMRLRKLHSVAIRVTLLISFLYFHSGISVVAQTNNNVSGGIIFDGEPYLIAQPGHPNHLVVGWMSMRLISGKFLIGIRTRVSQDGGVTWSSPVNIPHIGPSYHSADVSMTYDKSGWLYLSFIDHTENPDSGGVYVVRSQDGGYTWDEPTLVIDMYQIPSKKPIDRPWIVSDPNRPGILYITVKPPSWIPAPNRSYFTVSTDSGRTWSALAPVDQGTHLIGSLIAAPMAAPAVTSSGTFCTAYPSWVSAQNPLPAFYMGRSFDKGTTFSYSTIYSGVTSSADTNLKKGYTLLTHPVDSNRLVFVVPMKLNGDQDIWAIHSNDGGLSWSPPVRVNDDSISNGIDQDLAWGSYNEIGQLVISWRDRKASNVPGFWNAGYDIRYARSNDNGAHFTSSATLSSQIIAFDSVIAQDGNDFMCNTFAGDSLYAVWGDTRSGRMNIWFAKVHVGTQSGLPAVLLNKDNSIQLYPTLCTDEIRIQSNVKLPVHFIIYNATGSIQLQGEIHASKMINTASLPPGQYYLHLDNSLHPFIKQ